MINQPDDVKSSTDSNKFGSWEKLAESICPRCICRYTLAIVATVTSTENEIKEQLSRCFSLAKNFWSQVNLNTCCLCLGLLQDSFIEETIEKIASTVNEKPRQFKSFKLMYTLPNQLPVFTHLFVNDFYHLIEDNPADEPYDVKYLIKAIYDQKIASKLSVKKDHSSDGLEISINFDHKSSAAVFYPMAMEAAAENKKRSKKPWRKFGNHNNGLQKETDPTIAEMSEFVKKTDKQTLSQAAEKVNFASQCTVNVKLLHNPIYVAARYNKYSRELSQTPWFIEGKRLKENSVEELIALPVRACFEASDHKFMSSGREDVDVRMLGKGRPFIIELLDPHKILFTREEMGNLERDINAQTDDVAVNSLQIVDKVKCDLLKEGEEKKRKSYVAKCRFISPPSAQSLQALEQLTSRPHDSFDVDQKTPVRVLHRRSLAVRKRTIHSLQVLRYDDDLVFDIRLVTQAGTYVKEFVHGDLDRTSPSLCHILHAPVDIIDLDVEEIDLEWP